MVDFKRKSLKSKPKILKENVAKGERERRNVAKAERERRQGITQAGKSLFALIKKKDEKKQPNRQILISRATAEIKSLRQRNEYLEGLLSFDLK